MSPGATYSIITFSLGLILLLCWLYATADNPRSWVILAKSALLFALPIMFFPGGALARLGMWASVACEEGLKAFASTREQNRADRFWLVTVWNLGTDSRQAVLGPDLGVSYRELR